MIYLDHNATTPLDARVGDAMQPYMERFYGNPSGLYRLGRLCRSAVDTAREQVAALVGVEPSAVIFTSGGTEATNMALKGLPVTAGRRLVLTGATEHPSVSETAAFLGGHGLVHRVIPVDEQGLPDPVFVERQPGTELHCVSLMLANNETGVIHPVAELADSVRQRSAWLHCDAVQAAGKIPVDFKALGVDLMTLSSHKIYGPKGVGALIVDRAVTLQPLLHGGGQEQGLRGGTEAVAAIVGFGKAAELARYELEARTRHVLALRQQLETGLRQQTGGRIFAASTPRLPNTVQFALEGHDGETVVMALDRKGIAVSSGSACASGAGEPSPVLTAMGIPAGVARGAVRISLGQGNTPDEICRLLDAFETLPTPTFV